MKGALEMYVIDTKKLFNSTNYGHLKKPLSSEIIHVIKSGFILLFVPTRGNPQKTFFRSSLIYYNIMHVIRDYIYNNNNTKF